MGTRGREKRVQESSTPNSNAEQATGAAATTILMDRAVAEDSIQRKAAVYEADGHYDSASAMIKSIRGGDPGQVLDSPRVKARAKTPASSVDASPSSPAKTSATPTPEAPWSPPHAGNWSNASACPRPASSWQDAHLSRVAPKKSNASYLAIDEAIKDVEEGRTIPVPVYIKDGNVRKAAGLSADSAKGFGSGKAYVYSHDAANASVARIIWAWKKTTSDQRIVGMEVGGWMEMLKEHSGEAQ